MTRDKGIISIMGKGVRGEMRRREGGALPLLNEMRNEGKLRKL
jgi:hypothetical protein